MASLTLGLVACAPNTLPPPEGSRLASSPTTGGSLAVVPEPDSVTKEGPTNGSADSAVHYECDSGATIDVRYPNPETAIVDYKGQKHPMQIAISADGARYVGKKYEWWTRGSGSDGTGTLYVHEDFDTGPVIEQCQEQSNSA